jgi:hypothetical protein
MCSLDQYFAFYNRNLGVLSPAIELNCFQMILVAFEET